MCIYTYIYIFDSDAISFNPNLAHLPFKTMFQKRSQWHCPTAWSSKISGQSFCCISKTWTKKDETFFRTWGIRAEISGNHDAYYVTKYIYIYVKSQYMPWMCLAGVPAWRPRRSTGPMAQVPQGVENKRRGRRTNPRSVTWDVHP